MLDAWHYRDGSNRETEREYDENGNLVKDSDAKISSIQYNLLNLPRMIKFSDGGKHVYTYDASGRKLRAEHHVPIMVAAEPQVLVDEQLLLPMGLDTFEDEPQEAQPEELSGAEWEMPWDEFAAQAAPFICIMPPQPPDDEIFIEQPMPDDQLIEDEVPCDVTAIDYCGNFIYEDGTLRRILIPGGYVTFANNNINQPEYNCYLTDYQGNVRMVVDQSVNTKQIYHYYPYGGLMGGKEFPYSGIVNSIYGDLQPYKYNGKELDRHSGLDWYDYGARWYNGISWMTPDPLAEKYYDTSPYVYCLGNPIKYVDPDGEEPTAYEAVLMAKHVYGDKVKLIGGWHMSKTQYDTFNNHRSGFQSALYERTKDGKTEYAYVTAGTQDLKDAKEDVMQLFGKGEQYQQSIDNAYFLNDKYSGYELTFVGHSLGGGLAAANALATDRNAITFNPAAISNETKKELSLPTTTNKGNIFNVIVKGEIVSHMQSKVGLKPEGYSHTLDASYLPGKNVINTGLRIYNHLIDTVIKKLKEERK